MADQSDCNKNIQLLKSTRITVIVDEALEDMLVVTYELGVKIFKGILLDFTKRNLPFGISTLNPALAPLNTTKTNLDDDTLYSVNQRFAYTDPNHTKTKNVRMPSKYKNSKMTVRLRPRQVLCSKCKGICNENSENVSKKRKLQETVQIPPPKRSADAPITRSVYSEEKRKVQKQKLQPSLIPKIPRLLPHQINNALNGNLDRLSSFKKKENDAEILSDNSSDAIGKINLRKKRVSSTEDTTKENVEEKQPNVVSLNNMQCVNTRTIKISFGPQGEGTVLKIPAPIDNFKSSNMIEKKVDSKLELDSRAARKALKRAKKKARQKSLLAAHSPSHIVMSPRYSIGGSPRYSPRYLASLELPKRRKHKLKRKRKHKEEKDCKLRHNKRKRGAYKEAIRKATIDAKDISSTRIRRDTIMNSPSQSILNVPPPTLASPREIDVMS